MADVEEESGLVLEYAQMRTVLLSEVVLEEEGREKVNEVEVSLANVRAVFKVATRGGLDTTDGQLMAQVEGACGIRR